MEDTDIYDNAGDDEGKKIFIILLISVTFREFNIFGP